MRKVIDQLILEVHPDRYSAGRAAGTAAAERLKTVLAEKGKARVIFAAAPSQNETLETLATTSGIDWNKVTAFHMDEYIGLADDAPERFSFYLKTHIFDQCPFGEIHLLAGNNPQHLCEDYAQKLIAEPIDLVCMGIGENGHIAFNDPPVADFNDPQLVKIVELDDICRQQQVHDGCFPNLDAVPKRAVTLTVPALMSGGCLICTVPGQRKAVALHRMISGNISTECPATILRTHKNCTVFTDQFVVS
ncbi:MAG: glucosamine-6-phosphate deaminase [Planctomycetaceae bacterium]|jgi:glucosamine-6-phosphate deaminase|nr:glucosamine-6-phosphate deaminase [Planctomycetaceae bacterium]